jgi:cellulose synthase (UDP-forming)
VATRVWPDEQRFFFEVVMPSKDAWGGAFCCGTSSLIRFAPLQRIGGFPTDSVTEDYLVSLRLREIGYDTVYLNEPLSVGLAPEGLKEYTTQRSRWALGFVQIFCGPSGPMSPRPGIRLIDRIMLWETFLHWSATHLFRLLGLVVPALYLLFDVQAVYANLADAISHVAPYLIANMTVMMWMTRGRVLPLMADLSQLLCAQDIVRSVFAGLVRPKGHKFKVTAKGGDRSARFVQWRLLNVFLFYLVLSVAGIVRAFVLDDTRPLADSSAIALFWTWYNIAILTLACFVTIEAPQRRQGDRFASGAPGRVEAGGLVLERRIADISVSGARIEGPAPGPLGSVVVLSLDRLRVAATVARLYPDSFAVTFDSSRAARDAVIEHVYCGDYSAAVATIKPRQVMGAIAARLLH